MVDDHVFEDDGYGRCMECADRRREAEAAALAPSSPNSGEGDR